MSKEKLPEGVKVVPMTENDKKMAAEVKAKEEQLMNFDNVYSVTGFPFLWVPITGANKSGMVRIAEVLKPDNQKTVHRDKLVRLSNYTFLTLDNGLRLSISEVFNNLNNHFDNAEPKTLDQEQLMSVMVPNYDPFEFKGYHAKKVIVWYQEIANKLNDLSKEQK